VRMSVRTLQGAAKNSVKVTKAYNKNQIIRLHTADFSEMPRRLNACPIDEIIVEDTMLRLQTALRLESSAKPAPLNH